MVEHDHNLTEIWVGGEISNFSRASSGHIYFTLKDGSSALRCAFFRNRNTGQQTPLADGQSVMVYGSLSVYEQRGELSFIVDFVQPEGAGALAAEFERRRAEFEAEGLFALERKRALPVFPQRIGVVTSPTSAVFHDICDVLARRWPLATIVLQPAPVQGDRAPLAIAEAIRAVARDRGIDVLIVARGGGSAEDLWAFNEEAVIRAIFACPVPVISAVGHETDTTLADLVADLRAPTPSAAAELVAPDRVAVGRQMDGLASYVHLQLTRRLTRHREDTATHRRTLTRALLQTGLLRERVQGRVAVLERVWSATHRQAEYGVEALSARLRALSPLATLERGYAIVAREDGMPVISAAGLATGDRVRLQFADGTQPARIEPGV